MPASLRPARFGCARKIVLADRTAVERRETEVPEVDNHPFPTEVQRGEDVGVVGPAVAGGADSVGKRRVWSLRYEAHCGWPSAGKRAFGLVWPSDMKSHGTISASP